MATSFIIILKVVNLVKIYLMSKPNRKQYGLIFSLVILGVASRFLPHPPNVTAVAAVSLLAGALLNSRIFAVLLPLGLYYVSDFFINNTVSRSFFPEQEGLVLWSGYMTWVYIGFGVTALIGYIMLKKRNNKRLAGATVFATLAFWLLSNFGILIQAGGYPETIAGAMLCYGEAIPFLINSLIGNLVFSFLIFGIYDLVNARYFQGQRSLA